jgi:GNAT superfamily N-acetyltransferase
MAPQLHRGCSAGCIGQIASLHARDCSALSGFGLPVEANEARELSDFCRSPVPERHGPWLAVEGDRVEGSIAIDGSRAAQDGAHVRWFMLSEAVRGVGLGGRLLTTALAFCGEPDYRRVHPRKFQGLDTARHRYEKHGLRLTHEAPGTQWGSAVVARRFALGG